MKKAILVNIPLTELLYPAAGLAAIAPVFKQHGISTLISDLNLDLADAVSDDMLQKIYHWCELTCSLSIETTTFLTAWLEQKVLEWKSHDPDYIAISVFSYHSIVFAQLLLKVLKTQSLDSNIIIGGSGVSSNLNAITNHTTFGQQIIDNQWASNVIFGEGEVALDSLLDNKHYPGINTNNPIQVENLDQLLPPDYSDFDFGRYRDNRLLITGSRGCVRQCTFCDIDLTWPKFKYRSPESQVNEVIEHAKRYNVKRFEFTDSLINGSVAGWIKFNELLANAKQRDPELSDISYSGQFICRDQQSQPAIMYELMHYAGARQITVGIESFSERIRNAMKKKFNDASIEYHLEQCARWGIPNVLLMLVGHPEETIKDHQSNIAALHKFKNYSDMGIIFMIRWGTTMHILKDTPLYRDGMYDIHVNDLYNDSIYNWSNSGNPTLTLQERIRRRLELHVLSYQLGYSQPNSKSELTMLLNLLDSYSPVPSKKIFKINA